MFLASLNIDNELEPYAPEALPAQSWRQARVDDISWAREYLVPWVIRRIRHQSSGDHISAKRPVAAPHHPGQHTQELPQ
jgi:hypothetical protein